MTAANSDIKLDCPILHLDKGTINQKCNHQKYLSKTQDGHIDILLFTQAVHTPLSTLQRGSKFGKVISKSLNLRRLGSGSI